MRTGHSDAHRSQLMRHIGADPARKMEDDRGRRPSNRIAWGRGVCQLLCCLLQETCSNRSHY